MSRLHVTFLSCLLVASEALAGADARASKARSPELEAVASHVVVGRLEE
jgi:hypothetical protein